MENSRETDTVRPAESEPAATKKPVVVMATECKKGSRDRALFFGVIVFGPLKYMYKVLQRMMAVLGFSLAAEDVGSVNHQTSSPSARRVVSVKKRLSRMARFLLSFAPQRLQTILGYPMSKGLGEGAATVEVRQSPTKPCGKGNKRKVEDVDMEEQQSWIEALESDLPEDDEEDPTYHCSKSETDSEEYHSKNDTESDLEFEEKDGHLVLKDSAPEDAPQDEPVGSGDSTAEATEISAEATEISAEATEISAEASSVENVELHKANGDLGQQQHLSSTE